MFNRHFGPRFSNNRRPNRSQNRGQIDISRFINKKAVTETAADTAVTHQFSDFGLQPQLYQSVAKRGYAAPTPIQDQAILPIMEGRDLLGIANTGTGKTGAFLIPLIDKILRNRSEKVLIMAPTRELALQIDREFQVLTATLGMWSVLCIGGTSMYQQRYALGRQYSVVIGTPGRLKDLIQQKLLNVSGFSTVVLDEVDQMLDMGFINDIRQLLGYLPSARQSLFFSATVSPQISGLIMEFSHDLVTVSVKSAETAETVEQDIVRFQNQEDKIEVLHKLLIQKDFEKVLIFGRTKHGVHKLSRKLNDRGFRTDSIHGDKSQPQRQRALTQFRQNRISILVATDVAARGLDIDGVTHVINYDLPETYDDYVHRIGRTGRAWKRGKALTFIG